MLDDWRIECRQRARREFWCVVRACGAFKVQFLNAAGEIKPNPSYFRSVESALRAWELGRSNEERSRNG